MSVIGRMDEQVDEVLITPLSRKNKQETKERGDEQPSSRETTQIESDSAEKRRAASEELPVWLL